MYNFSRISDFPFENFLGKLTSLIRTQNRPLSQICLGYMIHFVMLKTKLLFEIKEITRTPDGIKIQGSPWRTKRSLFVYPTDSKDLFMWELQSKPSNELMNFNIKCIKLKIWYD